LFGGIVGQIPVDYKRRRFTRSGKSFLPVWEIDAIARRMLKLKISQFARAELSGFLKDASNNEANEDRKESLKPPRESRLHVD